MRAILVALSCFFLFACTNTSRVPEGILPKKKMESILWDIVQVERYTTFYIMRDTSRKNPDLERFKMYDQVFDIHKVSRENFLKSYKFYLARPDLGKVIFDSISAKVERQREERYKSPPAQ